MRHLPVATMGAGVARPATTAAAVHPSAGMAGHAVTSIDEARAHRQLDIIPRRDSARPSARPQPQQ